MNAERNFILQQGFDEPAAQSCELRYSVLLVQPRVILAIVVIATILHSPPVFLVLSAILWWSAILPRWNPFEAVYNATLGARPGALRLERAPAPRRFSQAMGAMLALVIGVSLLKGWKTSALVVEGFFLVMVVALAFGGFCLGSFVYHLIRGRASFALRTLPWARGRTEVSSTAPAGRELTPAQAKKLNRWQRMVQGCLWAAGAMIVVEGVLLLWPGVGRGVKLAGVAIFVELALSAAVLGAFGRCPACNTSFEAPPGELLPERCRQCGAVLKKGGLR